jgi:hypothetical protein
MADDAAPPPEPQPPVSTPYLVTQPDGSTSTYYLHTDRPPTIGEVADYAQSQGHSFAGFPEGPAAPARPEVEAPSPELRAAPPEAPPTFGQQAWNVVAPRRTFVSQWPSIAAAIPAATYGASVGSALGPVGTFVGGLTGAVAGGMGGEAAQYGAEQVVGSPPAEPGTFGQRVVGAGLRTGAGEVIGAPFRAVPEAAYGVVRPAAEAAERLRPILEGTAPTGAGMKAAEALSPQNPYNLARWWQENAIGRNPADIVSAWDKLGAESGIDAEAAQRALAGPHYADVQTLVGTLRQGGQSWPQALKQIGGQGWTSGGAAPYLFYAGHPTAALASLTPAVTDVLAPTAIAKGLTNPRGVSFLARLPPVARVAGPIFGLATRAAAQPIVYENWSPAASGEDWQPSR